DAGIRAEAGPVTAAAPADAATPAADAAVVQARSAADAAPPQPTPCPSSLDQRRAAGPCTLGDRCQVPDGVCFCDGYHGGIPPRPGVAYTHWTCGRQRNRTDGCPDNVRAGARCRKNGQRCAQLEGLYCGLVLECRGRRWVPTQNTCSNIPRRPRRR